MTYMMSILMFITVFWIGIIKPAVSESIPKLLIVSYDGFRHDYFDRGMTPFLKELKNNGTSTDYMTTVFSTKTLPNHHTISTGLYTETHGVLDNRFYHPETNKTYTYGKELYQYGYDILPIWTVNEKAGEERRSGTMWPGGEFEYHGKNITFPKPYNKSTTPKERIDLMISWFKHPKTPINLGMLYLEEPDSHAHRMSINSDQFNEVLKKLDVVTKYLHDRLRQESLEDLSIIHLSDHGMTSVTLERAINFTKYIDSADYIKYGLAPVVMIYPREGKKDLVYSKLKEASRIEKSFEVYLKEDIPEKYHFSHNSRVGPIVIEAKVGYAFQDLIEKAPSYAKQYNYTITEKSDFGFHGYDNSAMDMHAFFFGVGPAFVPKCKVPPFSNIDLYPLFCKILDLHCEPRNGTLGNLKSCLRKYQDF